MMSRNGRGKHDDRRWENDDNERNDDDDNDEEEKETYLDRDAERIKTARALQGLVLLLMSFV
jgi:hypothetical protein